MSSLYATFIPFNVLVALIPRAACTSTEVPSQDSRPAPCTNPSVHPACLQQAESRTTQTTAHPPQHKFHADRAAFS